MHDERGTRGRGLLPIEARRVLWDRLWARLLAPQEGTSGETTGDEVGIGAEARGASPTGEGGR